MYLLHRHGVIYLGLATNLIFFIRNLPGVFQGLSESYFLTYRIGILVISLDETIKITQK